MTDDLPFFGREFDARDLLGQIHQQLRSLEAGAIRTPNRETKKLIEESLPICFYAASLCSFATRCLVTLLDSSEHRDARVRIVYEDNQIDAFDVEVACVFSKDDRLRLELLNHEGWAPGYGKIEKDRTTKRIISENIAYLPQDRIAELASDINERITAKVINHYAVDSELLITFNQYLIRDFHHWYLLFRYLPWFPVDLPQRCPFRRIVLHNSHNNQMISISCRTRTFELAHAHRGF